LIVAYILFHAPNAQIFSEAKLISMLETSQPIYFSSNNMYRFVLLVLTIASVTAFQASIPRFAVVQQDDFSSTARFVMTEEETQAILKSATDCAEGECSIDDVSELLFELKEQEKVLSSRLDKIMNQISRLQNANEKEERKVDEVRSFVKDVLSVFQHDKVGKYSPNAYSGSIGDGPTTAYDALPPKKWKSST
jgi:septal ring factor EnvC (AmiA/AmiB activator)